MRPLVSYRIWDWSNHIDRYIYFEFYGVEEEIDPESDVMRVSIALTI